MTLQRVRWIGICSMVSAAFIGSTPAQSVPSKAVTNEHRLFQRFFEDGAVTDSVWFEGQVRFQSLEDADLFYVEPVLAVNVAEDLEFGGRIKLTMADPDQSDTETGLSDMDVYAKIRLSTKPTQFSLGLLLKLPTGDEEKSLLLGTGEVDVGFFGAVRRDFKSLTLVGSGGFRLNQDPSLPPPAQPEGEVSIQLGGGLLLPLTARWMAIAETTFETERFEDAGSDFRITLGTDFRRDQSSALRFGLALGNGHSAPEFELIGSAVFLF